MFICVVVADELNNNLGIKEDDGKDCRPAEHPGDFSLVVEVILEVIKPKVIFLLFRFCNFEIQIKQDKSSDEKENPINPVKDNY